MDGALHVLAMIPVGLHALAIRGHTPRLGSLFIIRRSADDTCAGIGWKAAGVCACTALCGLGGHREWARRASDVAACARTVAAASWAVATVLVVPAVIMPCAASTAAAVMLLPSSVSSVVVMVVLMRHVMSVPPSLVVVVGALVTIVDG